MCELFGLPAPCFETPPHWWTPLANLTAWFDWDAIGAVSTALALYMTIRLATEARRERRQREAVLLGTAAHILRAAYLSIRTSIQSSTASTTWSDGDRRYLERRFKEDDIDDRLDAIAPFHFPTVQTAEIYQAARLSIENIKDERSEPSGDWYKVVTEDQQQLLLNIEALEDASYNRSHSLIRILARRLWQILKRDRK